MKTYFYIHGYGSSVNSETVVKLRKFLPNLVALTYDFTCPEESVKKLAAEINSYPGELVIIGTSLGGWYAERLTEFVVADFVLYNPAISPYKTLSKLGVDKDIARKYDSINYNMNIRNRVVILATGDEVIWYKNAYKLYIDHARVVVTTGGHRIVTTDLIEKELQRLENKVC